MIEALAQRVNGNALLVHRGRFVDTTFMIDTGDETWLVTIAQGRITAVTKGPFVMPRWTFALRAPADAWAKFWTANPEPGFHDLMALVTSKLLKVEGDQHPFMANLLYFKAVLGSLRAEAA